MRITLEGQTEFNRKFRKVRGVAPKLMGTVLFEEANVIMTDSKRIYVPVDEGPLRGSGGVDEPKIRGKGVSVQLGFGGAASAYAIAIHEHPSEASPPSWKGKKLKFNVGGTKYLEIPVKKAAKGLEGRLKRRVGRRIENAAR